MANTLPADPSPEPFLAQRPYLTNTATERSSLYIHIPFCLSKCPYCDFFSQVGTQYQLDEYVELLCRDVDIQRQFYPRSPAFDTIYFGGGTPSLLTATQIETLLSAIDRTFGIISEAEITLEANPGTLQLQQLLDYHQTGVNRLSLGIQSLNDHNLQQLGRIHNQEQARSSIAMARKAGIDNLSLDLMFALPGQKCHALKQELKQLIEIHPEHLSIYGLTFEDGTEFARRQKLGELSCCEENMYVDQYRLVHEQLIEAGFEHYEISNFCQPGRRCRHNQAYWQRTTCHAIGAGAHSYIPEGWGKRWHIPSNLQRYKHLAQMGQPTAELLEDFDQQGAMREFVYLALRTSDGVNLIDFELRFNCQLEQAFAQAWEKSQPFLKSDNQRWYFELDGWLLYDHLISHFL